MREKELNEAKAKGEYTDNDQLVAWPKEFKPLIKQAFVFPSGCADSEA